MSGGYETAGKFYWPSDHYSIPADNLCWHIPPSPDADFRCIRPEGHPGKHKYEWSPKTRDHSHKTSEVRPMTAPTKAAQFSFDFECFRLAEHFGKDCDRPLSNIETNQLAQTIQDAVEDWLASNIGEARCA